MQQYELIHESINDALREVVQALGGTKKVGSLLKPDRTIDEASRWVSDCLNTERRERFDPDQVLWLLCAGCKIGCHGAMYYIARNAGYAATPVDPQDERADLQRQFIEATKHLSMMAARIETLSR